LESSDALGNPSPDIITPTVLQDVGPPYGPLVLKMDEGVTVDLGTDLFPNDGCSFPISDVEAKSLGSVSPSTPKGSSVLYRSIDTE
jgi:hypothetical protein